MVNQHFYPVSMPSITEKEISYVNKAMQSGWVSSLGECIDKFEHEFAKYCGVKYALTTSNGTTGLHLALATLNIGPGDEVIIPDLTFVATANAVSHTGAKSVIVDIDPDTLCISPDAIKQAVTAKSKAIIPVHLYGHPCDMDAINEIAKQNSLFVIEDAAEAHGAEYKGKRVGSLSDIGVFSLYGNKIITTGEGGILTTDDLHIYERAKFLRDHAMSKEKRYYHPEIGYNYRMTNIQAAMGLAQLERIDEIIKHRNDLYSWYQEFINTSKTVTLNYVAEWANSTYWMICMEIEGIDYDTRALFMAKLKELGVDTRPYFCPVSAMPMYSSENTPVSKYKSDIGLNLPTFFDLTRENVKEISEIVNTVLSEITQTISKCEV